MCHKLQDKKYQRARCLGLGYFMCLPALEEISSPLRHCLHCSTPNSYCSLSHISRPEIGHKFFLLDVTCWTFSPLPLKKKQKQKKNSFNFMSYISIPQYYPLFYSYLLISVPYPLIPWRFLLLVHYHCLQQFSWYNFLGFQ